MTGVEFQRYYDCGEMPERYWPEAMEKLREDYATDLISAQELEDSLDDLMGLTNA